MVLPDYWLTRPSIDFGDEARRDFDALLKTTLSDRGRPAIDYTLPWPKWQFLCHIADHHDIALHGSGDPHIDLFEPRKADDLNGFTATMSSMQAGKVKAGKP